MPASNYLPFFAAATAMSLPPLCSSALHPQVEPPCHGSHYFCHGLRVVSEWDRMTEPIGQTRKTSQTLCSRKAPSSTAPVARKVVTACVEVPNLKHQNS